MADKPVTREEKYLAYLTGDYTGELPKPITRKEKYLYELCLKGIGGEISPEEIKAAVNEYLEKNPVKPGATTEQAQQIEQNKTDIASLKLPLDNILSPNLYNPTDAKENTAINQGDGTEMSFDNWFATGYIPVSKGEVLYFSSNGEPTPYSTGAFYDKDKQRVDSFGNPNDNGNIAVTSDGYARFSFNSKKEKLQIEKGSRTTYIPYGELKVKADVDNIKEDVSNKITKFYASNQGETHITDSDNGKIQDMMIYGKSSQDGTPTPENPVEIKSVLNPTVKVTNEDGLKVQSVTLNNITLNAIPVKSGGNVTIDGQQYIADYVNVEHGKVIRNILKWRLGDLKYGFNNAVWHMNISELGIDGSKIGLSNMFKIQNGHYNTVTTSEVYISYDGKTAALNMRGMTDEEFKKWLREKNPEVYNVLTVAEEIPITLEEASAFKQLMTYYPVTNISVNSEQLDGYTVFNYPISMANGWNYVKKQLNDNRDYIYDMDIQAAEAYVNSEYAVALTELEV